MVMVEQGDDAKTRSKAVWVSNKTGIPVNTAEGESIDVAIQDQTTPSFDAYFFNTTSTSTLAVEAAKNATAITLAAGHGAAIGDAILITKESSAFFATITNVVVNVITLDTPMSGIYPVNSPVVIGDRDISNANGSLAAPISYSVTLPDLNGIQLDITRIMFQMVTASAVSLAEFGDIAALTNGIVLRMVPSSGDNIVYWNIKDNAQMALHAYDLTFWLATNPQQGTDGLAVRSTFGGPSKRGAVIRLSAGDMLELLIQDDITDITTFFLMAQGHVVRS